MKFTLVAGTGNNFALFDCFAEEPPNDPRQVALELCGAALASRAQLDANLSPDFRLDGILLLTRPREGGDCRMVIYNSDGSRPESCGNGLRCIALVAREREYVHSDEFTIETDSGLRRARVLRDKRHASGISGAEIHMGEPRIVERRVTLKTGHGAVEATIIDMGNPHCVLFARDEREAPVARLGAELERHRHFPARTNVEFVTVHPEGLQMRVWERGVGETAACGTGACAAAVAAVITNRASTPIDVKLAGGTLRITWDAPDGEVRLSGACEVLGSGELLPATQLLRENGA